MLNYPNIRFISLVIKALSLIALPLFLSSCYLPDKFELDIRVTKNGEYALRYTGDLISVNLKKKILSGELSDTELSEQLDIYYRDLLSDPSFSEVTHVGDGIFRVKYLYLSSIHRQPYFTFIRGNNKIFIIKYRKDKKILSLTANQLSETDKKRTGAAEYMPTGKIRVISDLKVLNHDADEVMDTKTPSYIWNVDSETTSAPFVNFYIE